MKIDSLVSTIMGAQIQPLPDTPHGYAFVDNDKHIPLRISYSGPRNSYLLQEKRPRINLQASDSRLDDNVWARKAQAVLGLNAMSRLLAIDVLKFGTGTLSSVLTKGVALVITQEIPSGMPDRMIAAIFTQNLITLRDNGLLVFPDTEEMRAIEIGVGAGGLHFSKG